jgi:hypothetical protein
MLAILSFMIRCNRFNFIKLLLGCVVIVMAGCSPVASAVLTREGEYASPSGVYTFKISIDSNHVVLFNIYDRASSALLVSGKTGAAYQRWFFFWESDAKLWVQSSDVGLFAVWEETSKGVFKEHAISADNDPLLKSVPPPVANALSNTMRQRFKL